MTAEVAVMNRMGVALAADSAVTVSMGVGSASKIYTSAEKLFQLSNVAPVGVMIYGNASYVSLPWETIIKDFRRRLGVQAFKTVGDYTESFIAFLRSNHALFPADSREAAMRRLAIAFLAEVRKKRKRVADEKKRERLTSKAAPLTAPEIAAIFTQVIDELTGEVKSDKLVSGVNASTRKKTRDFVRNNFKEWNESLFKDVPKEKSADKKLIDLASEYLVRQSHHLTPSGIVIAGFGTEEYMPALANFEVEDCVWGFPRMKPPTIERISDPGRAAFVMPFAQQDTVIHFLLGVDGGMSQFMSSSVSAMTNGAIDVLLDKVGEVDPELSKKLRAPVKKEIAGKLEELFETWSHQQARYFKPVLETIGVLPKDELAAMAESLVNLTKFRRRVTPVAETVSGPIDVAVITKGDGFVWIRRKHYFDPEYNPRILARLHQPETAHEQADTPPPRKSRTGGSRSVRRSTNGRRVPG